MGKVGGSSVCVTEPILKSLCLVESHRMLLSAAAGIKELPPLFYCLLLSVFMVFGTAGFVPDWFLELPWAQCLQLRSSFLHGCIWVEPLQWLCNAHSNTDPAPRSVCLHSKNEFIVFSLAFPFHSHASTKSLLSDLLLKPSRIINILKKYLSILRPCSGYEKSKWNLERRNDC